MVVTGLGAKEYYTEAAPRTPHKEQHPRATRRTRKGPKRTPKTHKNTENTPGKHKPTPGAPSVGRGIKHATNNKNTRPTPRCKTPLGPVGGHFWSIFGQKTTKTEAQRNVAGRILRPRGTFLRAFDPAYRQNGIKPLKAPKTDFSIFWNFLK